MNFSTKILEAYYEPQFRPSSHGFRPNRGCHSALSTIARTWNGTKWFIEGDISQCFDRLDHEVLLSILAERIHDNRFLRLIGELLRAGYLEEWRFNKTLSGTPQGGIVSPTLANIYLDRLDQFVEMVLLPKYTQGKTRRNNPTFARLCRMEAQRRKEGRLEEAKGLRKLKQQVPSLDAYDPAYRRLRYIRYADDFLLGFSGPHEEAEEIKRQLGEFLRDQLKLELSEEKTVITHARTQAAHFLGYEVTAMHDDQKHEKRGRRCINGVIGLKVPWEVVQAHCVPYLSHGKPIHRRDRNDDSVYSIISRYQQEYRGVVEYYQLAYNRHQLSRLNYVMGQSLVKTLAAKLKVSVPTIYDRYQTIAQVEDRPYKVLQVVVARGEGKKPLVAQWGGISLARKQTAILNDQPFSVWNTRTELEQRLLAHTCELCGSRERVQVHHVRALKDLQQPGRPHKPEWVQIMVARRRKTLVVCQRCHTDIHTGRLTWQQTMEQDTGEPGLLKGRRPVRRGADEKGP